MATIWNGWYWHLGLASLLAIGGAIASGNCAIAQVTPDVTLGAESSVVTPTAPGSTANVIDGGATRGTNLFHSFDEFSVPNGGEAYFNNAADIQNIIGRVTGGSISNIEGLLRANDQANLFLINPNGIIFGPNASLDIGGSFMGSTASSLNFADGTQFSATAPQATPLLTVSVPIGLQYGGTAGSILNQSRVTNSSGQIVGLQVQPGATLALLGGNVRLDGGQVQAPGGLVDLGGVAGAGTVGLSVDGNNLRSSFPDGVARADISLQNASNVDVRASGGGSIAVNARSLDVLGGSKLLAGIGEGLGAVGNKAGSVTLNATDAITLGQSSEIQNRVNLQAIGDSGDINVTARSLSIIDGAFLSASTFGQGNAGNVNVNVSDAVTVSGVSNDNSSKSRIASVISDGAVGNGGTITIKAGELSILNGALLNTAIIGSPDDILPGGRGTAGNVNIDVSGPVTIAGVNVTDGDRSRITSPVGSGAEGNGGSITINAESLSLTDGAQLQTSTIGQGNAGNIQVNAADSVELSGRTPDREFSSGLFASIIGNRDAGEIKVITKQLNILNGARVFAATLLGNGGNITLQVQNVLLLRNQSQINTSAGVVGSGNGGNIDIDAQFLVAVPSEDSDITADAFQGPGGRVIIDAQGIFGTEYREDDTSQSDITASSGLGPDFSGTVEINNPDVDPSQGLVELPAELVDVSNQIATGCPDAVWRGESKFIITGRGGLPPNPYESLRGDNTLTNWSTLEEPDGENRSSATPATNSTIESAPTTIVEANAWVKGPNGEVTLVATAPTAPIDIPWLPESSCNAPEPNS